jgi:hypothetical protein
MLWVVEFISTVCPQLLCSIFKLNSNQITPHILKGLLQYNTPLLHFKRNRNSSQISNKHIQIDIMLPTIAKQIASRRAFSILAARRTVAQFVQDYPLMHLKTTQKPAKADWGRQAEHIFGAAKFYVPAIGFFLGWPLLAEGLVNGHM